MMKIVVPPTERSIPMTPSTITPALKAQCIQEARDCKNATAVARQHGLPPRRVQQWVKEAARDTAPEDFRALTKALREHEVENAQLKPIFRTLSYPSLLPFCAVIRMGPALPSGNGAQLPREDRRGVGPR